MKNILITTIFLFISTIVLPNQSDKLEREKLISQIITLAENNICNPAFLETDEWKSFTTKLQSDEMQHMDDASFELAFNLAVRSLPFTHFYINYKEQSLSIETKKSEKRKAAFELKEIDETTAILTVRSFISDARGMVKLVKEIEAKSYQNLIIDLRNNTGGTLDAAVVLGRFLTNDMIDAGTYLTRNWFMENGRYPSLEEINSFPFLTDMTYKGFQKMSQGNGFRMVLPPHSNPIFKGNTYVLTNSKTASTCEPFVHLLKSKGKTIIGETTAGAMLSGRWFKLDDSFSLFVPIIDYVTADGNRLDKVGITPNIEVNSEDALSEALKQLKE
ncbi:S41 family peptidase [Spongiivirga citrea]|uniref:Tail specific protease domain-containing protein n=1 Tax=Spongiivirga citrea TaxID=1481457 RepID=A0A6M0CGR6_9FLAO|nr:S41 family peptidase [Spongiivirga citrea]NER17118.1 hypothetical protein [Spongiivirga citrea]